MKGKSNVMRRVIFALSIAAGLSVLISAAPPAKPPLLVPQNLAQPVKFDGIDDPRTTLTEALEKLTKLHNVNFDINDKAFRFENINEPGKAEIASPDPIPPMKNVRLSTVLSKILSRVPTPSGATYLLRSDRMEITTGAFAQAEVWGNYNGPKLPLVHATLEKCPLEDAVKELAEQSGFNVVLDNRATERAKTTVSARLLNTPLDTALRLLADMADMRAVHLDNVLYVTTKENAATLEARLEKERAADEMRVPYQRQGKGPGIMTVTPEQGGM